MSFNVAPTVAYPNWMPAQIEEQIEVFARSRLISPIPTTEHHLFSDWKIVEPYIPLAKIFEICLSMMLQTNDDFERQSSLDIIFEHLIPASVSVMTSTRFIYTYDEKTLRHIKVVDKRSIDLLNNVLDENTRIQIKEIVLSSFERFEKYFAESPRVDELIKWIRMNMRIQSVKFKLLEPNLMEIEVSE